MGKPLENLLNTTIETILEAIDHKPWTAFINNAVAFTGVILNNQELIQEIKEVQANPSFLTEIESQVVLKFGKKYENDLVGIIFKYVWGALIYNTSTVIAISEAVKEWKEESGLQPK